MKTTLSLSILLLVGSCPIFAQAKKQPVAKKVAICHKTTGKNPTSKTMRVHESAVSGHLAHGDMQGACPLGGR